MSPRCVQCHTAIGVVSPNSVHLFRFAPRHSGSTPATLRQHSGNTPVAFPGRATTFQAASPRRVRYHVNSLRRSVDVMQCCWETVGIASFSSTNLPLPFSPSSCLIRLPTPLKQFCRKVVFFLRKSLQKVTESCPRFVEERRFRIRRAEGCRRVAGGLPEGCRRVAGGYRTNSTIPNVWRDDDLQFKRNSLCNYQHKHHFPFVRVIRVKTKEDKKLRVPRREFSLQILKKEKKNPPKK